MSRRPAIVEEFDDDTDLPLPSLALPNTGTRGPLLEELHISDDEFEPSQRAGPASPLRSSDSSRQPLQHQQQQNQPQTPSHNMTNIVTDITPYKTWTCIYPIYLDAKRPYGTGQRRVERQKSLWWPLSKDIAEAATRLGLGTLHEVQKAHPRDWGNPGRVRVQWKKDGRLVNPIIRTKKQLLEMISYQIQHLKPENIPKPPFNMTPKDTPTPAPKPTSTLNKGKQPATAKPRPTTTPQPKKTGGCRLPIPPEPLPPLANRVSPYSPAVSTGVLIETIKAGMNTSENQPVGNVPGNPNGPAGGQKGKRKVMRVNVR